MIKGMVNRLQAMAGFRDGLIAVVLAMGVSFSVAAGDAADLMRKGNTLTCRIAAWPETESRLVLTRLDPIASITLNGKPLAFTHDAARRIAVVTLPPCANGVLKIQTK